MSTTALPDSQQLFGQGGIPTFQTEPWAADFSMGYYFSLVDVLRADRQLFTFSEAAQALEETPPIKLGLLRHDIDIDLGRALQLARLEAERDIKATYFVIPNAEAYRADDPQTIQTLGVIADCGHEIGLHFNPDEWTRANVTDVKDLEQAIHEQADQLSAAIGHEILSVSYHKPGPGHPTWMNGPLMLAGLVNAYAGVFMSPARSALYATDSNARWSFGEPQSRLRQAIAAEARVIQLLTHAESWELPQ